MIWFCIGYDIVWWCGMVGYGVACYDTVWCVIVCVGLGVRLRVRVRVRADGAHSGGGGDQSRTAKAFV